MISLHAGGTTLWPLPVFPTSSCAVWPFGLWVLVVHSLNRVQLYSSSMDCSPPGSSIHGVLQARILEWIAISSSRGSSWPRNWTWVSCLADESFPLSHLGSPGFCYPGLFSLPQSPWVHSLLKAFAHSVPSLGCSSSRSLQHCHDSQKGTTVSKVAPIPALRFRVTVSLHLHIIFIVLTALWDYSGHMYVYECPSQD